MRNLKSDQKSKWMVRTLILAGACSAMSFTMPSCPGQQAIQQQLDSLSTSQTELAKRTQKLEAEVKAGGSDLTNMKQLLEQLGNAVQAQKAGLDQLNNSIHELDAKVTALAAQKKAPPAKPTKKRH